MRSGSADARDTTFTSAQSSHCSTTVLRNWLARSTCTTLRFAIGSLGANGDFALSMLVGDLERGYEWLTLTYLGADFIDVTRDGLAALGLTDAGVELIQDEVDVLADGRYEHRILAWPDGEFGVRFRSLRVRRETASSSDRR